MKPIFYKTLVFCYFFYLYLLLWLPTDMFKRFHSQDVFRTRSRLSFFGQISNQLDSPGNSEKTSGHNAPETVGLHPDSETHRRVPTTGETPIIGDRTRSSVVEVRRSSLCLVLHDRTPETESWLVDDPGGDLEEWTTHRLVGVHRRTQEPPVTGRPTDDIEVEELK